MPVSSSVHQRTFTRKKLIKTTTANTMSDNQLNDLCVSAVEHDLVINFGKLMNDIADFHKNIIIFW